MKVWELVRRVFSQASSLAGLEDIEEKLEIMDKMTPEEADVTWHLVFENNWAGDVKICYRIQ